MSGLAGDLATRWNDLWQRLGCASSARAILEENFVALEASYRQPSRTYHGVAHLRSCLATLDGARATAVRPDEVELALWFHDAVYDPRATDNEARSAEWAARVAHAASLAGDVVARVAELVRATTHEAVPTDADAQLVCDVDLAILGAPPAEFDAYEHAIRAEYDWVPATVFRARRAEILERFLARPSIYATRHLRDGREAQARLNLTRSLAALRAPGDPPRGP